ncbi:glycosyltransferase family 2 protein [uncultured Ruminococcus sp.]|uniref:glycosyltransferase family 2 protein n=1 Tax=uncultured Ruminococcus sp. TaxID=165186 RepID=UPI00260834E4|nr:glycosyltransferase family 2 protein [uncultured Ruminococcus sp.]
MKYSVVMCTYNGERFIADQIKSILAQTHKVDEILIFDDRSSDNTVRIAEELLAESGISYRITVNEVNKGVARNFIDGMKCAAGDYIFTCDQDDVWKKTKVETFHRHILKTGKMLYFSDGIVVDEHLNRTGSLWKSVKYDQKREDISVTMLKKDIVTGAAMAVSHRLAEMIEDIPESILHDRWCSLIATVNDSIECIRACTFFYRQHSNNVIGAKKLSFSEWIREMGIFNSKKQAEKRHQKADVFCRLKKYCNKNNYARVAQRADFWYGCDRLPVIGRKKAVAFIFGNSLNGNYFRYRTGLISAARDLYFVAVTSGKAKKA